MGPFDDLLHFQTYSTIFIYRQINRANFVVRGPSPFFDPGYLLNLLIWILPELIN